MVGTQCMCSILSLAAGFSRLEGKDRSGTS